MVSKVISYDDVAEAARRLAESGDTPSATKVRTILGRGGMSTIQKHLNTWRDSDEAKEAEPALVPEMPEQLAEDGEMLIKQIWYKARKEVEGEISLEREALAGERERLNQEMTEVMKVSDAQEAEIEALRERVELLESERQAQGSELVVVQERLQGALTNVAVLEERCSQYEAASDAGKEREAALLNQIESLTQKFSQKVLSNSKS